MTEKLESLAFTGVQCARAASLLATAGQYAYAHNATSSYNEPSTGEFSAALMTTLRQAVAALGLELVAPPVVDVADVVEGLKKIAQSADHGSRRIHHAQAACDEIDAIASALLSQLKPSETVMGR